MLRRILIGLVALFLIGVLVIVVVVRQIVFGGTPTIHRSVTKPALAASPCTTINTASNLRAFSINSQKSDASYEAHFLVEGQTVPGTVMGITGDVSGEFLITSDDQPTIMSMTMIVDLRTLDSGSSERDNHVRNDTLEVNKYPYATFTVMDAQVLPGSYSEGQNVTFKLKGSLTIHGVTRPTTFTMQGQLANNMVIGSAATLIHLQDFNMKTPMTTAAVTITVSKDITLTVHFTGQRESCTHLSLL
jgi:polyisoprenoid-binding protein YceI